MVVLTEIYVII